MSPSQIINQSFTLPCGVTIPNRIVKSALSENNADSNGKPNDRIIKLYETWGKGGAGVLISGNVMMDSKALGEAHNVVIEDEKYLPELNRWATACQKNGSHLWMQINHPGRHRYFSTRICYGIHALGIHFRVEWRGRCSEKRESLSFSNAL